MLFWPFIIFSEWLCRYSFVKLYNPLVILVIQIIQNGSRMKNHLQTCFQKRFFPFIFFLFIYTAGNAQHLILGNDEVQIEAGLNFGPTFFLGDLGGKVGKGTTFIKDLNFKLTKVMKGAFIAIYPTEWYGIRLAGQYTYVEGIDPLINTNGVDELWRKQRNLDFKSNVWEVYAAVEFFPLQFLKRNNEEYNPRLRPYIFGGLGAFQFNPQGSMQDQNGNITWHALHPLRTEGQGFAEYPDKKPYSLTQLNLPFGAGFKYLASDNVNIAFELLYRKTFTDYMDDVSTTYIDRTLFDKYLSVSDAAVAKLISDKTIGIVTPGVTRYAPGEQRGNSYNNDAYFSFVLKFGIRFGSQFSNSYNKGASNRTRCPVRF